MRFARLWRRLSKAEDEMRNAASHQDASAQQRAANELAQAQESMRNMMHQQANSGLSDLAEKARQVAEAQKDLGQRVKKMYGAEGVEYRSDAGRRHARHAGNERAWICGRMVSQADAAGAGSASYRTGKRVWRRKATNWRTRCEQLQNELQRQAQSLAGQQPEATRKMRKALSDAEQEEIAVRMKKER